MANRPIFPGTIQNAGLDVENADGTTLQDLVTAGANGSRINSISVVSDDTAAVVLEFYYYDGTTAFLIGSVSIPTLSGTDGSAPAVSALNLTDMPFLGDDLSYYLAGTDKIQVAAVAAVTAAKKVTLIATYGDY